MAYRKRRMTYRKSRKPRRAGRIAQRVARKTFRAGIRMPKRKLAKMYATKSGQTAFRSASRRRRSRRSRRR